MAAAAYEAVVSVMHLLSHIKHYHARQPIFLEKQLRQLESLKQKVSFLQDFLEVYSNGGSKEMEVLESRIAYAAYAVEDVIESYIVDDIHARSRKNLSKKKCNKKGNHVRSISGKRSSNDFSQDLQKVIEDMDFIRKEVMKIKQMNMVKDHCYQDLASASSVGSPQIGKFTMMEFDDNLNKIVDKITREHSSLQIISITGMGGIGKTTLAKMAYDCSFIVQCFDIRGCITISQEYSVPDMLLVLLLNIGVSITNREKEEKEYHQLGQKLHKHLSSRRYLFMLDDMWDIEAWDKLKLFFPDNNNGSRIMITTRLSNVANNFGVSNLYEMKLLDENESWSLLCKNVFVQEECPPELEEIGRKIAKNCKGLPLSIVVIGGLLAKSNMTSQYWNYVSEDISTTVNLEDNERCLKILSLSYNHLSIHLKPCFLYFGVFVEDENIRVSDLINLWVAEGFLKPHIAKSLEEVAKGYLKDLINRNLIFVSAFGSTGNMKYCKIHDILRDLCLREAQKEKFIYVSTVHSPATFRDMNTRRRIAIHLHKQRDKKPLEVLHALHSSPFTRSLTCNFRNDLPLSLNYKLLRVLNTFISCPQEFLLLVNSRYQCSLDGSRCFTASSLYLLWNLQTLKILVYSPHVIVPFEIWGMLHLRHLNIIQGSGVTLSDPPCCKIDEIDDFVLENLQTLSLVENFKCTEDVVKRIPNIKKLKIRYSCFRTKFSHYSLNNLDRLLKLESLFCWFLSFKFCSTPTFLQNLSFPNSLKKLTLRDCNFDGEGITTKIGLLPHLEKLKLELCYIGEEWNPVEGQFLSLKYLKIYCNDYLVNWAADSAHFPCLEQLVLVSVHRLKEIPSGIGEIETLRSIQLDLCTHSIVASAEKILEEQQSLGNEDFRLVVGKEEEEEEEEEGEEHLYNEQAFKMIIKNCEQDGVDKQGHVIDGWSVKSHNI